VRSRVKGDEGMAALDEFVTRIKKETKDKKEVRP